MIELAIALSFIAVAVGAFAFGVWVGEYRATKRRGTILDLMKQLSEMAEPRPAIDPYEEETK